MQKRNENYKIKKLKSFQKLRDSSGPIKSDNPIIFFPHFKVFTTLLDVSFCIRVKDKPLV